MEHLRTLKDLASAPLTPMQAILANQHFRADLEARNYQTRAWNTLTHSGRLWRGHIEHDPRFDGPYPELVLQPPPEIVRGYLRPGGTDADSIPANPAQINAPRNRVARAIQPVQEFNRKGNTPGARVETNAATVETGAVGADKAKAAAEAAKAIEEAKTKAEADKAAAETARAYYASKQAAKQPDKAQVDAVAEAQAKKASTAVAADAAVKIANEAKATPADPEKKAIAEQAAAAAVQVAKAAAKDADTVALAQPGVADKAKVEDAASAAQAAVSSAETAASSGTTAAKPISYPKPIEPQSNTEESVRDAILQNFISAGNIGTPSTDEASKARVALASTIGTQLQSYDTLLSQNPSSVSVEKATRDFPKSAENAYKRGFMTAFPSTKQGDKEMLKQLGAFKQSIATEVNAPISTRGVQHPVRKLLGIGSVSLKRSAVHTETSIAKKPRVVSHREMDKSSVSSSSDVETKLLDD
jgi:hypothetical protein